MCTCTRAPSSFHWCERLEQRDGVATQRFRTAGYCARRDRAYAAGDHRRAANSLGRQIGGRGHRLDHEAFERALTQLADQQSRKKCPLVLGSSREEHGEHAPALGDGACAARARDLLQRVIDFHER